VDCGQMAVIWCIRRCPPCGVGLIWEAGVLWAGVLRAGVLCAGVLCAGILGSSLLSGHAAADPIPTASHATNPGVTDPDQVMAMEIRTLATMWALLHAGRAAEAYQLGRIAVAAHADSARLLLALAYAAAKSGKCQLALSHLANLVDGDLNILYRRRLDMVRAQCSGPWQKETTISLTAGYSRSLVDRARLVTMRLAPGSALHGLCTRLRGLCNPEADFRVKNARDSGIDIWTQLSLGRHYRDGGNWDLAVTPTLFFRTPRRKNYGGEGASLRLGAQRYLTGGRQLQFSAESGVARFRQGDKAPAISQTHRQLGLGFVMPHSDKLASRIGHRRDIVSSRWLDLRRNVTDFRLSADGGGMLSGWVRLSVEKSSQAGPGLMPGARTRDHEAGIGLRFTRMQIVLHHRWRNERFTTALPYLAAPHRAKTRRAGIVMIPDIHWSSNLKVVISFDHRRILSPDPYRPRSTKNLFMTVKYSFPATP